MRAEAQGELSGLARKAGTTRGARGAARGRARKARMRAFDAFVETRAGIGIERAERRA